MRTAEFKLFPGEGVNGTWDAAGFENRAIRRIAHTHLMR
jgi:hypothetical protein